MPTPLPREVWNLSDAELVALLDSGALEPLQGTVRFYVPSFSHYRTPQFCGNTTEFPTVSVTGNGCALNCRHCGGIVLKTMHPATSPKALWELGAKLKDDGARGVLVSGGCLPNGSVPLEPFTSVLARFKHELGLTVFVHTGIISKENASALRQARIDAALIDIIGSDQTVEAVYNLNVSVQNYKDSLAALQSAGVPFIPHVIVGLDRGKLGGEYNALELIQRFKPAAVVIIAFMPIPGTEMAKVTPPAPLDIARVAACARLMFPKTPLALGCMRPKGAARSQTDVYAVKAGVDAVAFPAQAAVSFAEKAGYAIAYSRFCCAQMYLDAAR